MADGKTNQEIERKFLLKELPQNYDKFKKYNIEQTYINLSNPEHRIRKQDEIYYETFKGEGNISRTEEEHIIDESKYNELLNRGITKTIYKTRYMIPINNNLIAELNCYKEDLKSLYLIEVEFDNIEDANNFIKPDWFGEDVTNNPKFKNQNLAMCKTEEIKDLIDNRS